MDVGCGTGIHLRELVARGHRCAGIDYDVKNVERLKNDGFDVVRGRAEALPFPDASFDAIVCSVVLPYTDERAAAG